MKIINVDEALGLFGTNKIFDEIIGVIIVGVTVWVILKLLGKMTVIRPSDSLIRVARILVIVTTVVVEIGLLIKVAQGERAYHYTSETIAIVDGIEKASFTKNGTTDRNQVDVDVMMTNGERYTVNVGDVINEDIHKGSKVRVVEKRVVMTDEPQSVGENTKTLGKNTLITFENVEYVK